MKIAAKLHGAVRALAACALTMCAAGAAQALTVVVPGTSNPWLAGMPDGTTAVAGDSAPAQSPVLVNGVSFSAGSVLLFSKASGGVSHTGSCPSSCDPIDGSTLFSHSGGAEHGIAGLRAPINALVGVFLGAGQPDLSAAPAGLDFGPAPNLGLDFLSLSPLLKQVFFIGDGMTSASVMQRFVVPEGATRLYLGTHDGYGWYNNNGSISIDVTAAVIPEPGIYLMLVAGLAVLLARRRTAAAIR